MEGLQGQRGEKKRASERRVGGGEIKVVRRGSVSEGPGRPPARVEQLCAAWCARPGSARLDITARRLTQRLQRPLAPPPGGGGATCSSSHLPCSSHLGSLAPGEDSGRSRRTQKKKWTAKFCSPPFVALHHDTTRTRAHIPRFPRSNGLSSSSATRAITPRNWAMDWTH